MPGSNTFRISALNQSASTWPRWFLPLANGVIFQANDNPEFGRDDAGRETYTFTPAPCPALLPTGLDCYQLDLESDEGNFIGIIRRQLHELLPCLAALDRIDVCCRPARGGRRDPHVRPAYCSKRIGCIEIETRRAVGAQGRPVLL